MGAALAAVHSAAAVHQEAGKAMRWIEWRDAPYGEVLARQREIFGRMVEKKRKGMSVAEDETVMLVEHRPVYTLGRHADPHNIINREMMTARGAEIVNIERGGDITFHGPGQLVVYPIIDFGSRGMGVKEYVTMLEEAVIRTIAEYGVKGERIEGATGVWIGRGTPRERKICAIGIKCSRFVAMHGLALNVTTDLSWFSAINPCGFTDKGVTSLALEAASGSTSAVDWEAVAGSMREKVLGLLSC